ncbi:hypothetical protein CVT25_008424 [Psilocybe cyanescens]|uniref:Uncharacterized protein n=1 Tax=Psilocybe cyanescens TaxID=93625 RepID=A0A409WUY4_PSICY|nr:hypothetical protein CVT25_008424 [Psilocybe cyanescens]
MSTGASHLRQSISQSTSPSEPIVTSDVSLGSNRSVSCELNLQAGEYVILPKIEAEDRFFARKRKRMLNELSTAYKKVLPQNDQTDDNIREEGLFNLACLSELDTELSKADSDIPPIIRQPSLISSYALESEDFCEEEDSDEENEKDKNTGGKPESYT